MEARDGQPRVRPLEPAPEAGEVTPDPVLRQRRRAPEVVVASGILVFGLLLVVFGTGGRSQDTGDDVLPGLGEAGAVPNITTTTTTLPPRLDELLPIAGNPLIVVSSEPTPAAAIWLPDQRSPRIYALPTPGIASATFDAGAGFVAMIDEDSRALLAGKSPGNVAELIAERVSGAAWHPTEPGALAFTSEELFRVVLGVAEFHTDLLGTTTVRVMARLPLGSRLVTWGDWGYIVETPAPESSEGAERAILVLDATGAPQRAMPGRAVTAGGGVVLVAGIDPAASPEKAAADLSSAGLAPTVAMPPVGLALFDQTFTRVGPEILGEVTAAPTVTISASGKTVALSTITDTGRTSITIVDLEGRAPRIVSLDAPADALGFIGTESFFALQDRDTLALYIVDWRSGSQYEVPTGDRVVIAASL